MTVESRSIQMKMVESSNIHSIGYDEETETLFIAFRNNGDISTYGYENFSPTAYKLFMETESHGKMFHALIRGKYRDARVPVTSPLMDRLKFTE